jgi:hypothetical protein
MLDFIYKVNMKLKLETSLPVANSPAGSEVTILVVTEGIESANLAILKAGLNKLIVSGKRNLLLDCGLLKESDIKDPGLFIQISNLRGWASTLEGQGGAQVIVVSPLEKLGHARTREEGVALLSSAAAPLLALEAKLQNDIRVLQSRKADIEAKITQASAAGDPRALLRENSDFKKSIVETERLTQRFLKNRSKDPFQLPATDLLQEALDQLLGSALKKEGILL